MALLRFLTILLCMILGTARATSLLIPMDETQQNHLKAYGLAYYVLRSGKEVQWLLNYRGGSFLMDHSAIIESECKVRGVSFEVIPAERKRAILNEIESPSANMNTIQLLTAPRIAVYSPKNAMIMDESDAVIQVLDYAEIPYQVLYDAEVLRDELVKFDWLHLHHEDFTGQHGRFLRRESAIIESKLQEATAQQLGYSKVSQMKLDVAKKIKAYCAGGGFLFAMCSAAETLDIALAAEGIDIAESVYDGDDPDTDAQSRLDFKKTFAFENFTLDPGNSRRFSDINTGRPNFFEEREDYFTVFTFSAKWDIVPSLLTQDHEMVIKEFRGQTSAFNPATIKPSVLVMGENKRGENVRYIYGELGRGHWTFYGGHDPEGNPGRRMQPTDLNLHPHSPGYRLILNNVLFPSAKRKKQKT